MKNRQTKTLIEKYGISSILVDANRFLQKCKHRWQEDFDKLPHLGICYLDWDDRKAGSELIYYFEDFSIENTSLIKLKVLEVNEDYFIIAHYDDHHHDICLRKAKTMEYEITGNIIKSL